MDRAGPMMRANDRRPMMIRHTVAFSIVQLAICIGALWVLQTFYIGQRLRSPDSWHQRSLDRSSLLEDRLAQRATELLQDMEDPGDRAHHARAHAMAVRKRVEAERLSRMTQEAAQAARRQRTKSMEDQGEDDVRDNDLQKQPETPNGHARGAIVPQEATSDPRDSQARASALLDKYQHLLGEVSETKEASGEATSAAAGDKRKGQHQPPVELQIREANTTSRRSRPSETDRHIKQLKIMGSPNRTDKVAFLFLTRGKLPFEKVWAKFFGQDKQGRHSIFIHAPAQYTYPPDSIWHGRKLPPKSVFRVMWGEPTMVEAERSLLQHALLDPGIVKFALVSESDIPVQSFGCAHKTMTEKPHSFAQSVPMTSQMPLKIREFISSKDWRKGSQWFVLNREHAHMVAEDRDLFPLFKRYCTIYSLTPCISDEHYIPTLLAHRKAEATTQLYRHSLTWTDWRKGAPSPETFKRNAPVKSKMLEVRRCHYSGPNHSKKVFYPLMMREECGEKTGEEYFSGLGNINDADEIRRPCYVFARKFAPELANKVSGSFDSVVGGHSSFTSDTFQFNSVNF